jgi:hypothetical protein
MSRFAEAIEQARREAQPQAPVATPPLDEGPEVRLSVRLPKGLRSAVASTAADQGVTVTAFVNRALHKAIIEANDSIAGLAADLARNVRSEIRSAIDDGTYRAASAEVGREERGPSGHRSSPAAEPPDRT